MELYHGGGKLNSAAGFNRLGPNLPWNDISASIVAALPLSRWNYKTDPSQQHVGPMAQDFYAAFAVGPDDKHITTVDADGVALAAIQGLNQKLAEQKVENAKLKEQNDTLAQRLSELEAIVRIITQK